MIRKKKNKYSVLSIIALVFSVVFLGIFLVASIRVGGSFVKIYKGLKIPVFELQEDGDFYYITKDERVSIIGLTKVGRGKKELIIPDKIENKKVAEIGLYNSRGKIKGENIKNLFTVKENILGETKTEKIYLGKNIGRLDWNYLKDIKSLNYVVVINDSLKIKNCDNYKKFVFSPNIYYEGSIVSNLIYEYNYDYILNLFYEQIYEIHLKEQTNNILNEESFLILQEKYNEFLSYLISIKDKSFDEASRKEIVNQLVFLRNPIMNDEIKREKINYLFWNKIETESEIILFEELLAELINKGPIDLRYEEYYKEIEKSAILDVCYIIDIYFQDLKNNIYFIDYVKSEEKITEVAEPSPPSENILDRYKIDKVSANFGGWFLDKECTITYTEETKLGEGLLYLYAKWNVD